MSETGKTDAAKRVIGNTMILYVRMIIVTCVSIFSFRLLIENLHIEGYGVFTAVYFLVALLGFFNTAVTSAGQRFLNIELGKNSPKNVSSVFSCSLFLFCLLALFVIVLGETVGLYYLHHKLVYPAEFRSGIDIVYQLILLSSCIKILQQPFHLLVIAHERMGLFAAATLIDSFINLGVVALLFFFRNAVVMYSLGIVINSLVIFTIYVGYCKIHHPDVCRLSILKSYKPYLKKMSSFFGWSVLESSAASVSQQGLNLILNSFGGVLVSAAHGAALQLSNPVNAFLINFQVPLTPYLMKSYVQVSKEKCAELICRSSKYSLFLLSFFVIPLIVNTEEVLSILTLETSKYTLTFVRLVMLQLLLNSLSFPLSTEIQATGRIRRYQMSISIVLIAQLPLCFLLLKWGMPFYSVYLAGMATEVLALAVRLGCLKKIAKFPIGLFGRETLSRAVLVFGAVGTGVYLFKFTAVGIVSLVLNSALIDTMILVIILLLGVSSEERRFISQLILRKKNEFSE